MSNNQINMTITIWKENRIANKCGKRKPRGQTREAHARA